jgi:hypothetical protein
MNKKAMMDDFFDFLFTIVIAFFSLIFIGFLLNNSVDSANSFSLSQMIDVGTTGAAISNLRFEQYQGFGIDKEDFDKEVANVKVIEIKKDYGCGDYDTKEYCDTDPARVTPAGYECWWSEQTKKCYQKKQTNPEVKAANKALNDFK